MISVNKIYETFSTFNVLHLKNLTRIFGNLHPWMNNVSKNYAKFSVNYSIIKILKRKSVFSVFK